MLSKETVINQNTSNVPYLPRFLTVVRTHAISTTSRNDFRDHDAKQLGLIFSLKRFCFSRVRRAPPIFGRATITLGIGPHSSVKYGLHIKLMYRFL